MLTIEEAKRKYSEVTSNQWDFEKFIEELFGEFNDKLDEAYEDGRSDGYEECIQDHT